MKTIQTSISCKKKYLFTILDLLQVEVEETENPYNLPISELFTMAARINKKRSFLFVSKLIGKHLPVDPKKALLTSALLAVRYYETISGEAFERKSAYLSEFSRKDPRFDSKCFIPETISPLIIGFAETATALGQGFFDCFSQAEYFHTTRERLIGQEPVITFEEEHSHATSHRCYIPLEMIDNVREIILVDDELTTGRTALNIIRSIHARFPRKKYSVAAILDWRSEESKRQFSQLEQELGITIQVISLLAGLVKVETYKSLSEGQMENLRITKMEVTTERISITEFFPKQTAQSVTEAGVCSSVPFIQETGRFGLKSKDGIELTERLRICAQYLAEKRVGGRTLCLGTGEFMYLPLRLAAEMGKGVSFQSTSRSPIFVSDTDGYGVRFGAVFPNPDDTSTTHFVYNIPRGFYDEVFIFFEREADETSLELLLYELKKTGIQSIKLVFFSEKSR